MAFSSLISRSRPWAVGAGAGASSSPAMTPRPSPPPPYEYNKPLHHAGNSHHSHVHHAQPVPATSQHQGGANLASLFQSSLSQSANGAPSLTDLLLNQNPHALMKSVGADERVSDSTSKASPCRCSSSTDRGHSPSPH